MSGAQPYSGASSVRLGTTLHVLWFTRAPEKNEPLRKSANSTGIEPSGHVPVVQKLLP